MIKRILAMILAIMLMIPGAAALNSSIAPAESAGASFSFLFFGDIQVTESPETDYAAWGNLAAAAKRNHPGTAFALQAGDIVESGIDRTQWAAFFKNTEAALGELPFFPTSGNHESNFPGGKPEIYLELFSLPQNGPDGFKEEFYSFDYGDAHITVLNSWVFSGEQNLTGEDLERIDAWVAGDLAKSAASWKIVLTHIPVYAIHSDSTSAKVREHWSHIFEKYGVTLVLVGHQHVYSRLKPLTGGAVDYIDGVTQIMGNSGRKYYSSADESRAENTIYNTTTYQNLSIDGDMLTVQTFDIDGTELDYAILRPREINVTRGEYIGTLWRAAGEPDANGHSFSDVPEEDAAIAWAYEAGLILGYGSGSFGYDDKITREQVQIILSRMEIRED